MAKQQLTAKEVQRLAREDGLHRVGPGLYLRVRGRSALWTFRYTQAGKTREPSLGPLETLSLADALAKAADLRAKVKRGEAIDVRPVPVSAGPKPADTFRAVAEQFIEAMRPGWKNAKHADQWTNTLATYAYPKLGSKPVSAIGTGDVLEVLSPIWKDKHETATRVRGRIEAVLSAAKARGLRAGENPALWRGNLDQLLPTISKRRRVQHHPALPWQNAPAFMAELRERQSMSALALQFTMLTATRTGESIGMLWPEVKLEEGLWIIPAARMKAVREHRVPLSKQALRLLQDLPRMEGSDVVFWGSRKPHLSNMAMLELLRGMRPGLTVHGFRSTFRDWAAEATSFPADVVEMALAHTIQNQVEAAYRRGELLAKRAELMQEWAAYLESAAQS
ncbi:MAG: tyrosine-type recombinase/integrase [Betaproteobacteria bacterium]|nr:tyrosine-type recombinase/integrase [Betaproteobacteria bacterium]